MTPDEETGEGTETRPRQSGEAREETAGETVFEETPDDARQEGGEEPTDRGAGLTELVAGVTGVAQDRLVKLRDDIIARGEVTREGLQRSAFKALFPLEAARLEELERRLELMEGRLIEPGGKLTPDSKRRTGFASTAEFPDEKVDTRP